MLQSRDNPRTAASALRPNAARRDEHEKTAADRPGRRAGRDRAVLPVPLPHRVTDDKKGPHHAVLFSPANAGSG